MRTTDSPIETTPLRHCTVGDFLDVLASDAILPGAGAAGGIALALAAACAGKAVAITLRHEPGIGVLEDLQERLARLMHEAVVLGQQDAIQFKQQLQSDDPGASVALLRTDHTILELCRKLELLLDTNEELITDNMRGDWRAARALLRACWSIQKQNIRELGSAQ